MIPRDEIEQVIAKWRERVDRHAARATAATDVTNFDRQDSAAYATRLCADDLEALLRRSRAVRSPGGAAEKDTPPEICRCGHHRHMHATPLGKCVHVFPNRHQCGCNGYVFSADETLRVALKGAVEKDMHAFKADVDDASCRVCGDWPNAPQHGKGAAEGPSRAVPEESK